MPGPSTSAVCCRKVTGVPSIAASRMNSWRTPSGHTISPRPPARSRISLSTSSWMIVLPSPKAAKMARLPPSTAQATMARWCGFSRGLISAGSMGNPQRESKSTFAARNPSYDGSPTARLLGGGQPGRPLLLVAVAEAASGAVTAAALGPVEVLYGVADAFDVLAPAVHLHQPRAFGITQFRHL